jgi:hypothetical protein
MDETWSCFEVAWKPKKWAKVYRFLFIRQRCPFLRKDPLQLDLFIPYEYLGKRVWERGSVREFRNSLLIASSIS